LHCMVPMGSSRGSCCLACPALGVDAHAPLRRDGGDAPPEHVATDELPEEVEAPVAHQPARPGTRVEEEAAARIQASYRRHVSRSWWREGRARKGSGFVPPSCPAGHTLLASSASEPRPCTRCDETIAEGALVHECRQCGYSACDSCADDSCGEVLQVGDEVLQVGEQVRLCNMRLPELNCLGVTVVQAAGCRRYTVRFAGLGDEPLTLPLSSLCRARDPDGGGGQRRPGGDGAGCEDDERPPGSARTMVRSMSAAGVASAVRRTLRRHTTRLGRSVSLAGPLLEAWWAEKKLRAVEQLVEVSAPLLKHLLDNVGALLRHCALRDPDLWGWLRPAVRSAVRGLWEDIEAEVELGVEAAVHRMGDRARGGGGSGHPAATAVAAAAPAPEPPAAAGSLLGRLKAGFLHHYLPSDKTFFGKARDPVYLAMVAVTSLPIFGVRFVFFGSLLAMMTLPGPPDEYQLVSFILHFKGTQFFTSGVLMTLIGAMQMFSCHLSLAEDLRDCLTARGPGAGQLVSGLAADYFGSVALVWIAFALLPRSRKHPSRAGLRRTTSMMVRGTYCCCLQGVLTQGGRLLRLLRYDIICFLVSVGIFVSEYALYAVTQGARDSPPARLARAKAVIYWGNCLYALLSLPFLLFVIPVFSRLLTHSVITGYNSQGVLVEFAFREEQGCKGV